MLQEICIIGRETVKLKIDLTENVKVMLHIKDLSL